MTVTALDQRPQTNAITGNVSIAFVEAQPLFSNTRKMKVLEDNRKFPIEPCLPSTDLYEVARASMESGSTASVPNTKVD